jgi:hypothetical protein
MSKKIYSKKELSELVDEKGGKIKGGKKYNQTQMATSGKQTNDSWNEIDPETGEIEKTHYGKVQTQRQDLPPYQLYGRYYGESLEPKSLDEIAKDNMKNVLEDIISKKNFSKDILDKLKNGNEIPDVDLLKDDQPVLVRKISHIKSLLDRSDVSGEDKAILLNSLLSINLTDIPTQYKRELVRKLGY